MGLSSATNGAKSRRRRSRKKAMLSEINVTPLVDVMLVLLIVFMVAAPLMTVGVPLDLPQTQAKALDVQNKPITISLTNEAQIFIGEEQVELDGLIVKLQEISGNQTLEENKETRIFVRGDASADYGTVMKIMGVLSKNGYSKIGLITEQEQGQ